MLDLFQQKNYCIKTLLVCAWNIPKSLCGVLVYLLSLRPFASNLLLHHSLTHPSHTSSQSCVVWFPRAVGSCSVVICSKPDILMLTHFVFAEDFASLRGSVGCIHLLCMVFEVSRSFTPAFDTSVLPTFPFYTSISCYIPLPSHII